MNPCGLGYLLNSENNNLAYGVTVRKSHTILLGGQTLRHRRLQASCQYPTGHRP